MADVALLSLPYELLLSISKLVQEIHSPSLRSLALVNKQLNSIAGPLVYNTIKLTVKTPSRLVQDLATLSACVRVENVRCLVIEGGMKLQEDEDDKQDNKKSRLSDNLHAYAPHHTGFQYSFSSAAALSRYHTKEASNARRNERSEYSEASDTKEDDAAWLPLAIWIRSLSSLYDLIFACWTQLPPCILAAVQIRSKCRLHINDLRFRTLHTCRPDPHEIAIASSPRLYSISVYCDSHMHGHVEMDRRTRPSTLLRAVPRTVLRLAPNLQEVFTQSATEYDANGEQAIRKPWKHCSRASCQNALCDPNHTVSTVSLKTLVWGLDCKILTYWSQDPDYRTQIDWNVLQTLELKPLELSTQRITAETLTYLLSISSFPSLTTLSLTLDKLDEDNVAPPDNNLDCVVDFLFAIPPIKALSINGELHPRIIESIYERHGSTLKSLALSQYEPGENGVVFDRKAVERLATACPSLIDLSLDFARSLGDANEVQLYRTLGSLHDLLNLNLTIHALNIEIDWSDEKDIEPDRWINYTYDICEPRTKYAMQYLINRNLDESLARAIFAAISEGKSATACPLQVLSTKTAEAKEDDDLRQLDQLTFYHLADKQENSFRVYYDLRDTHSHEIIVEQLESVGKTIKHSNRPMPILDEELYPNSVKILDYIWPNWRDRGEWPSSPLAVVPPP
ncbi:hypothetical protein BT63DRAFT_459947 [Microthyrium microscopicum]|uniref:Uncharacterized protein n=1 Tax=Microthyrium microscopicum TaxID=703497 RepID=A0A6A6TWM1_9PEZI|nr:hypothetical protein BT63DRAFT_459947 [Microthyrium microscopicum]